MIKRAGAWHGASEQAGSQHNTICLARCDLRFMLQRHTDFVQAFQQAGAAERVDLKAGPESFRAGEFTVLQVYGEAEASGSVAGLELGHFRGPQRHSEQSVLHAVVGKDVSKAGGDDAADAVITQRPHSMLAR